MSLVDSQPLVSIVMPYYNNRDTLQLALASLLFQTYQNWECIFIDDGSTDNPREIIEQANDKRIKYFRLKYNMGRACARQAALDRATGEFLAMLDADDWYYPNKLELQVEIMKNEPKLTLLSTAMAIVNKKNELEGIRGRGPFSKFPVVLGPCNKLKFPPFSHAPSIIKMSKAKAFKFDEKLTNAEDMDFLIKVLMNSYFCLIYNPTYVYNEHSSKTLEKYLSHFRDSINVFEKYKDRFPIMSRVNILRSCFKYGIHWVTYKTYLNDLLLKSRSEKPNEIEIKDFYKAKNCVYSKAKDIFPDSVI